MYVSTNDCQPCGTGMDRGLEYVGAGRGEYTMDTVFKYQGYGGDFGVRRRNNYCCLALSMLIPLMLLLMLLAYLLFRDECDVGGDHYSWPMDKQWRCCAKGKVPCPPTPDVFPSPALDLGTVDPYNCADGFTNWKAEWSVAKKQWCCTTHGRGCGADAEVPAAQYDCNNGMPNWVKGWSEGKKQWCCAHGTKSCPQDAAFAGAGYGAGSHHGLTPNGATVATAPQGFIPFAATPSANR